MEVIGLWETSEKKQERGESPGVWTRTLWSIMGSATQLKSQEQGQHMQSCFLCSRKPHYSGTSAAGGFWRSEVFHSPTAAYKVSLEVKFKKPVCRQPGDFKSGGRRRVPKLCPYGLSRGQKRISNRVDLRGPCHQQPNTLYQTLYFAVLPSPSHHRFANN